MNRGKKLSRKGFAIVPILTLLAICVWIGGASAAMASRSQGPNCGPLNFTGAGFDVNSRPFALATGDFDGDGKTDLASANYFSGSTSDNIALLFGNGNGHFDRFASYQFGALPSAIATGDFNRDGKLDLVVCHSGSNAVTILFNDGTGAFPRGSAFIINNPRSVAVGDFNDDGGPDLAVTEFGSSYLWVIPVSRDGSFQAAERYIVGQDPISVVAGDFNKDGKLDLATANFSANTISVLQNRGEGKFNAAINYTVGDAPESIAVGDFNTDGKADLAVASANTNAVWVYLNQPKGKGFQSPTAYAVGKVPLAVATADLNLDGLPDLLVANLGENSVSVLLNDRGNNFVDFTKLRVGERPAAIAVGDFKADGKPDFAVALSGTTSVTEFINTTVCESVISTLTIAYALPNPSKVGQEISFRVNVYAADGRTVPTGQVQLLEHGSAISPWLPLTEGKARFSTNDFKPGLHWIVARFSGDARHRPSMGITIQIVFPK